MPRAFEIHLNRDGPHSIEAASPSFEADGAFEVVLRNHGTALHVHLHLDDDLSAAASLGATNHYVEAEDVHRVRVGVREGRLPVEGRLKVVTGYGTETRYLPVTIREPGTTESRVEVDERLGDPRPREEATPLIDPETLPVAAMAVVALLVVALAAVVVRDAVVLLGLLVVLLGIGLAGVLLRG